MRSGRRVRIKHWVCAQCRPGLGLPEHDIDLTAEGAIDPVRAKARDLKVTVEEAT